MRRLILTFAVVLSVGVLSFAADLPDEKDFDTERPPDGTVAKDRDGNEFTYKSQWWFRGGRRFRRVRYYQPSYQYYQNSYAYTQPSYYFYRYYEVPAAYVVPAAAKNDYEIDYNKALQQLLDERRREEKHRQFLEVAQALSPGYGSSYANSNLRVGNYTVTGTTIYGYQQSNYANVASQDDTLALALVQSIGQTGALLDNAGDRVAQADAIRAEGRSRVAAIFALGQASVIPKQTTTQVQVQTGSSTVPVPVPTPGQPAEAVPAPQPVPQPVQPRMPRIGEKAAFLTQTDCLKCHAGASPKGGLNMTDLAKLTPDVRLEAARRISLPAGDPEAMPPGKPLPPERRNALMAELLKRQGRVTVRR